MGRCTPSLKLSGRPSHQWRKLNVPLNSNPSKFKGNKQPIEQVSLGRCSGVLPTIESIYGEDISTSELKQNGNMLVELGQLPPFPFWRSDHNSDLANYNGSSNLWRWAKVEKYRQETTDVGIFPRPMPLVCMTCMGMYFEWCLDHWHSKIIVERLQITVRPG